MDRQLVPTYELMERFDVLHKQLLGVPAVFHRGKDGLCLTKLCRSHGIDLVCELMDAFFASRDPFIQQAGYTIGVFFACFAKLIAQRFADRLPAPETQTPRTAAQTTLRTLRRAER